ncbi:MAG: hypothetical protein AAGD92_06205 [Pseudomonadota bacterium]
MGTERRLFATIGILAWLCMHATAHAQTTGLVIGPRVNPEDRSFEYRFAYDPGAERFNQRIHYQHSVSDRLRLRATAILNDSGASNEQRFRFLQLEAHHQFVKRTHGWNSAFQYQAQIPDGNDGPGSLRLAWANSFDVGKAWEFRAVGLATRAFGDNQPNGFRLETRASAARRFGRYEIGAQSFNVYGSTADFPSLSDQVHSAGPMARSRLGDSFILQLGALFGLTRGAPDANLRFLLQYQL